ncbi:phosphotransferase-like protein [Kribbella sp. CA-293567]|uniref:phosphotransferase-like protein n=1 Tax=Kribbella sp. CA-293567 TaxID=3002436 RepID=UPI003FA609D0
MTSIVFLNGAPSTGKTTLARGLHARLPGPVFYQSLDDFRRSIRAEFWLRGRVPGLFDRVVEAYVSCLREIALRGIDIVAESIILPADLPRYDALFGEFDVTLIGITCPLPVLRQRELQRDDRYNGPLEPDLSDYEALGAHSYELLIDTSTESTSTSLQRIIQHLSERGAGDGVGAVEERDAGVEGEGPAERFGGAQVRSDGSAEGWIGDGRDQRDRLGG